MIGLGNTIRVVSLCGVSGVCFMEYLEAQTFIESM